MTQEIPGYTMRKVPNAPFSAEEFAQMRATALFSDEDVRYLRLSASVLENQIEDVLDVWYGFIGSQPQLVSDFVDSKTGEPDGDYLGAVRRRFAQWIRDTAQAEYNDEWLAYQFEIGRRHHRIGKNQTDNANGSPIVRFRHLLPILFPVLATLRPFLGKRGHSAEDVEGMANAWMKSLLLQLAIWSHPYVKNGDW